MENYECALIWCPLFSITEDEKTAFLEKIKDGKIGNGSLSSFIFDTMYKEGYDYTDSDILEATRRVILNHLIFKTDFALDTLSTENYENAKECYNNCQYNSDILDTLIKYFTLAWGCLRDQNGKPLFLDGKRIFSVLRGDIDITLASIKNEYILDTYAILMAVINTICTVSYECYLNNEDDKASLENDLNTYIIDTYSYDFNKATEQTEYICSEYFKNKVNEKLQLALLNDKKFWKEKTFLVTSFLNQVYKNSIENAKSIIDYIFKNLHKDKDNSLLIRNGLSIGFSLEILKKKLKEYAILDGFNENLTYPLFKCDDNIINEGRKIFESFLYDYIYHHCKETVKERLTKSIKQNAPCSLFDALMNATVGLYIKGHEGHALYTLDKEFFTDEAIYKRVYIKSYYLSKLSTQDDVNYALFDCFFNLTEELNRSLNIKTSIQLNEKIRKEKLDLLKNILLKYSIDIEYKEDYIAAMVDVKSATVSELNRFNELQNLGSDIYDFALAELIFFNPYLISPEYEHDKYSDYKSKIEIARKINLNEAYICHANDKQKFYFDISKGVMDFTRLNDLGKKDKHLSYFLDMLLGAYSLDKGHNEAISLAKLLIIDTFPTIFRKNEDLLVTGEKRKEYINSYLEILNALKYKHQYFNIMHRCLYNLLGNLVLKASIEDKKSLALYSPDRIAPLFGDTRFFTEITPPFKCYLEYGIDEVISQYGKTALESFKKR